jgi:hypothetical protein
MWLATSPPPRFTSQTHAANLIRTNEYIFMCVL